MAHVNNSPAPRDTTPVPLKAVAAGDHRWSDRSPAAVRGVGLGNEGDEQSAVGSAPRVGRPLGRSSALRAEAAAGKGFDANVQMLDESGQALPPVVGPGHAPRIVRVHEACPQTPSARAGPLVWLEPRVPPEHHRRARAGPLTRLEQHVPPKHHCVIQRPSVASDAEQVSSNTRYVLTRHHGIGASTGCRSTNTTARTRAMPASRTHPPRRVDLFIAHVNNSPRNPPQQPRARPGSRRRSRPQPPATAGRIVSSAPSGSGVCRPSRKRMSSPAR